MSLGNCCFRSTVIALLAGLLVLVHPGRSRAVQFAFDFSLDTAGFFADPARRETLNSAASVWGRYVDRLDAIQPCDGNHWTAVFTNPQGGLASVSNLVIPQNTILVYVAARDLGPGRLGLSNLGQGIATGSAEWQQQIAARGQDISVGSDFGPWGGSIAFSSTTPWHFGKTTEDLAADQFDFLSVAVHELGHLLGFGLADSYFHQVSQNTFVGPLALAVNSPNNPSLALSADGRHWQADTASASSGQPIALMDPIVAPGQRRLPTPLDLAALEDIGWEPAIPGDANSDGCVDVLDVNALVPNFGKSGFFGWSEGDFTGDGVVDVLDINAMRPHFDRAAAGAVSGVPEPSAAVLAVAVGVVLAIMRFLK